MVAKILVKYLKFKRNRLFFYVSLTRFMGEHIKFCPFVASRIVGPYNGGIGITGLEKAKFGGGFVQIP